MILAYTAVADPDLQIRMGGGGGWSFKPWDKGGAVSNKIFSSVSSKNKEGGGWRSGSLGPLPRICHYTVGCFGLVHDCFCLHLQHIETATKLPSSNGPSPYLKSCFSLTLPNLLSSYNQIWQLNSVMSISMELNRSPQKYTCINARLIKYFWASTQRPTKILFTHNGFQNRL